MTDKTEQQIRHKGINTVWFYKRVKTCEDLNLHKDMHRVGFLCLVNGVFYGDQEDIDLQISPHGRGYRMDLVEIEELLQRILVVKNRVEGQLISPLPPYKLYATLEEAQTACGLEERDDCAWMVKTFPTIVELRFFLEAIHAEYDKIEAEIWGDTRHQRNVKYKKDYLERLRNEQSI